MPNYRSKMLTFLSLGEMSSMLLDNTDEDGILFAVATDATNFKIVMWRKSSSATVDNDLVYSANGPGRWHVLANGSLAKLADVNVLNPTTGQALVFNGTKWVNQTIATGEANIPELMVYDDTLGSATPPTGAKLAVVNKVSGDELYVAKNDTWELLDIAGGDDTIAFADLPTGTTSNTVATGNHSHTLDNLSDVFITSPAVGHTISFDGSSWINALASGGSSDIIQFATNTLPSSPAPGKSMCVLTKTDPPRTLTYAWNSGWRLVSFTNIYYDFGSGDIELVGDADGQIAINLANNAIFIWNSYLWQQIYP
jgi:hypothetical protein